MAQLLRRIDLFNGKRVVAIATGGTVRCKRDDGSHHLLSIDPPGQVRDAFAGHDCTFLEVPHDPRLREVAAFLPQLERVASTDPNECVFCGHAKGVTHPVNPGVSVHRWAEICYETCLDYWPLVARQLQTHCCTGAFKKVGSYFRTPSNFHYSGSFYWLRSADLFDVAARDWRGVDRQWYGVEPYPGVMYPSDQAACLFWERSGVVDLYSLDYLRDTIEPAYAAWKEENRQHHRPGGAA